VGSRLYFVRTTTGILAIFALEDRGGRLVPALCAELSLPQENVRDYYPSLAVRTTLGS